MAVITVRAKVSIVNIIAVMTIDTATIAPVLFRPWLEVAAMAMQSIMGSLDLKTGLFMIELPDKPIVWVMTLLAIVTQRLFVNIIVLVTVITT